MAVTAFKKLFSYKLVRYGVIGGVSTLIHFAVASAYIYFLSPSLLISNIVGFIVAYLFSYVMQSLHVFGHPLTWQKAFKYFIVQLASLLISVKISSWLEGYNVYIQTVVVIILMPLVTFTVHSVWTFSHKEGEAHR